MNKDSWGEIINGEGTYLTIAQNLLKGRSCIIGWTDEGMEHRDIMFTYLPVKYGTLQRGLNWNSHLYVSIIGFSSMGFLTEWKTDNRKSNNYIKEKLNLSNNSCDLKICELINGVIHALDNTERED